MTTDVFGIVGSVQAGTYRVECVVAEGGFGVVYRAFHESFRAPVALKCLKVPMQMAPEHQAEFLEKFRAEGELLFRLSAALPAVVRPLHVDAFTTPDGTFVPYMALEWLTGQTLTQFVEERAAAGLPPLAVGELFDLLGPVALALGRAHHFATDTGVVSIVHRDLKPDNLFIAVVHGERAVKILDFGIAKARSAATQMVGRQSQHKSQLVAFSPGFAAPEQWLPKRFGQTGPWTDVYSLAQTMVEVMRGRTHPEGEPGDLMTLAIDEKRRPTPRMRGLGVTDAVEAVFERALAVDPRHRYADAREFWSDLALALGAAVHPTTAPPAPILVAPPVAAPAVVAFEVPDLEVPGGSFTAASAALPRFTPPARAVVERAPAPSAAPRAPAPTPALSQPPAPVRASAPVPAPVPAFDAVPMADRWAPIEVDTSQPVRPLRSRPPAHEQVESPAFGAWLAALTLPGVVLLLGAAVTVGVNLFAGETGQIPMLGPVPLATIGGGLSAVGLGWGLLRAWRLFF